MGEDTIENRTQDTVKLLNFGFNTYRVNLIKSKDETIGKVKVINGKEKEVEVKLINDASEVLGADEKISNYHFDINIDKLKAPVKVGDVIGSVKITNENGKLITTSYITVKKDVLKANFWDYFKKHFSYAISFDY